MVFMHVEQIMRVSLRRLCHTLSVPQFVPPRQAPRQAWGLQQCWSQGRREQGGEATALHTTSRMVKDLTCALEVRTFHGNAGLRQHCA